MYKLLLVDDERIIREGITNTVDWDMLNIDVKQASNGLEALKMINEDAPDIVISDIKMPGLDGLGLIEKVKEKFPEIVFVILSGYGEFGFASRAMQFGVKHYLLKPCDELEIMSILKEAIHEIKQKKQRREFLQNMKRNLNMVMPQVKEQFLRDCVMNKSSMNKQKEYFMKLLNIHTKKIQLLLFQLEGEFDFEKIFALKNLSEELLGDGNIILSTIINDNIVILIKPMIFDQISILIHEIKKQFYDCYGIHFTIAISEKNDFKNVSLMYKDTMECLKYRFYLGEGSIITKADIWNSMQTQQYDFSFDYEKIAIDIKSGNYEEVEKEFYDFFNKVNAAKCEINIVKTYCLELYMSIIRQAQMDKIDYYVNKIIQLQQFNSFEQIFEFILSVAKEIVQHNYKKNIQKNNKLINKVMQYIDENIENEKLSLTWLAKEILYINEDYLGKLFKKETNENFSKYILRVRMERAKILLEEKDCKICNVAEKVGYGNNPTYFGQVFKKYTGFVPSEYRKIHS